MSDNTHIDINRIIELYDENKSITEIAQHFNTYTNRIRRALIKAGRKMRTASEAQKIALMSGRKEHPTKGKPRSEETKKKISEKVTGFWEDLKINNKEEFEKHQKRCRDIWNKMGDDEKKQMQSLAGKAIRRASVEGSRLENIIRDALIGEGYTVEFHRKNIIANEKLEVDIYIPTYKIAIEVNGPAHYFPVWGDESLQRHIDADKVKMGLLLTNGFRYIIVKAIRQTESKAIFKELTDKILAVVNEIIDTVPSNFIRELEL